MAAQINIVDPKDKDVQSTFELIGEKKLFGKTVIVCEKQKASDFVNDRYYFKFTSVPIKIYAFDCSFSFKNLDNAFENFANLCIDGFDNPPEKEDSRAKYGYYEVELEDGNVFIEYDTSGIGVAMRFTYFESGQKLKSTVFMYKKAALQLFGRSKKNKRKSKK